jgi:hypothetical protein
MFEQAFNCCKAQGVKASTVPVTDVVMQILLFSGRYILGIESPLVCDILPLADDQYGLMEVTEKQFQPTHMSGSPNTDESSRYVAMPFTLTNTQQTYLLTLDIFVN